MRETHHRNASYGACETHNQCASHVRCETHALRAFNTKELDVKDKRPEPNPRKHPELWQAYLWWHELMEMQKRHNLRIIAAERGKSNYSAAFERDMLEVVHLDEVLSYARSLMVEYGQAVGPVWDWLTSIKGLGAGGEAAKLLAQIDDIGKFVTISKLWAFAGWAVDNDGETQHLKKGQKAPYNRDLKAICWRIADQFVKQRTPVYREEYDSYKEDDRRKHPNVICQKCGSLFPPDVKRCPGCKATNTGYNLLYCAAHLDARARRKIAKLFLSHLWVKWREEDGLPVSDPYVIAVLEHTNMIPVPV